jgi:hypothetical protein
VQSISSDLRNQINCLRDLVQTLINQLNSNDNSNIKAPNININ